MKSTVLDIITKSNKVAGLHCQFESDATITYFLIIINKTNKGFEIVSRIQDTSEENIAKKCKSLPVILSIDGKGIIHKKTRIIDNSNIIEKLFPGIVASQFNVQILPSNDGEAFASICRKDQIEQTLEKLQSNSILITNIILGPFTLPVKFEQVDFSSGNQNIALRNSKITEITKNGNSTSKILIDNFEFNGNEIISYTNAVSYFSAIDIESDIKKDVFRKEYQNAKLFKFLGMSGLLFLLMVLLVNFFAFDYYRKKQEILDQQVNFNAELSRKLEALRSEYKIKQELLQKSGLLQNTKISFYISFLINEMPTDIKLRNLAYQPVSGKIKDKEEVLIERNSLIITGVSISSEPVNEWLGAMKKIKWIKEASLENYSQEDFNVPGEFELKITLNEP